MVSVQAAAGSIINQAMRGFLEDMTVDLSDPNGLLEEYWAASRFWEYTEMEWDNGPFGKDIPETAVYIKGGEMERSAIPKPAFYIKRGEMERDLAVSTKRRESAESAKRRPLERLRRRSMVKRIMVVLTSHHNFDAHRRSDFSFFPPTTLKFKWLG